MPPRVALVIAVAIAALSTASVLCVQAIGLGVSPLAIGFWRTALVAGLFVPAALWCRRGAIPESGIREGGIPENAPSNRVGGRDLGRIALGGVFLALHFACWIHSLALTSVLRSTVLVTLAPAWAALFEALVWRSPPPRRFWVGIAVSLGGVVVLSGALGAGRGTPSPGPTDTNPTTNPTINPTINPTTAPGASQRGASLTGDALAVAGGVFGAGYWLAGRAARARVGIGAYAGLVSAAAALVLLPLALATGAPLGPYSSEVWIVLAVIALGPQLVGHNGINYAMRHISASRASGLVLLEPVGASLLAALALSQIPAAHELAGGAIVVVGVFVATMPTRRRASGAPAPDSSARS